MTFRNTKLAWGSLTKALHWVIVLLIINQWWIAERADDLKGLAKLQALAWHKSFGMTIFMLAIIRLVWRWMNPTLMRTRRSVMTSSLVLTVTAAETRIPSGITTRNQAQ